MDGLVLKNLLKFIHENLLNCKLWKMAWLWISDWDQMDDKGFRNLQYRGFDCIF